MKQGWASALGYLGLIAVVALAAHLLGLTFRQVASTSVLAAIIGGSLLFWRYRVAFALLGIAFLLTLGLVDIAHMVEFAGLDIILFLIGMMLLVGFLDERLFFERLVDSLIFYTGTSAFWLTVLLLALSALFSALVSEVTSILFMAATVFTITGRYRQNPIPFLLMVIFATNIGSAATVVGNPVGILIALRSGLTFFDFLRWATPVAIAAFLLSMPLLMFYFRKAIISLGQAMRQEREQEIVGVESRPSLWAPSMRLPWLLFLATLAALIFHAHIEQALDLEKDTMLLGVALAAGGVVLLIERERAKELLERKVEWGTLTFFLLLFASVGTLKLTGVTKWLADSMAATVGGSDVALFLGLTWASGLLSSVIDNVAAIATFIPVVQDLGATGVDVFPLWWGLLFGGTFMGNLTIIGSTANIVALGLMERRGLGSISFGYWLKALTIPTLATMALASFLLYLQLLR